MRIAVLGNQPNWSFTELRRAAAPGDQVEFIAWPQLMARIGGSNPSDLEQAGLPEIGFDVVVVRGMPLGTLEQVIFRMNVLARWQSTGTRIINSPRALEISIDKYLSLALIADSGLSVPETEICQSVDAAMEAWERLGGDVVIKPVFGGQGRGLVRVSDPDLALRSFRAVINLDGIVYAQKYVDHPGFDIRMLVIGQDVLAMRRENPDDWRTNASRGAACYSWTPSTTETEMALTAARATRTDIAGIDLIHDDAGRVLVLEVNGVPGWQRIAEVTKTDVGAMVTGYLSATDARPDRAATSPVPQ